MLKETDIIVKQKDNAIGVISLRADNIITFIPNPGVTKTSLEILRKDLITFIDWTKETGPIPFISDNRNLKQMSTEERLYIQDKLPIFTSKFAIIVDGALSTYFFNLLTYINKPTIPIKAFKNFDQAILWLKKTNE